MDKKLKRTVLIVGILFFVLGMIALLNAPEAGLAMAQNAINSHGGSMDTELYYRIVQSSTLSVQLCGVILSAIGGLSTILPVCKSNEK